MKKELLILQAVWGVLSSTSFRLLRFSSLITILLLLSCGKDGSVSPMGEKPDEDTTVVRRYGVRWQTDNPYDLGERCFDAVGLGARFGIGEREGYSDFDNIYPWSGIRRCNVRQEGGRAVVVYDDDPDFRIDGTGGDVFVRIPKFYVEKYQEDGYEYRVVSARGEHLHPAFIENGEELDAIYVGAFEGSVGSDGLLHSVAGVIPTSNITAQEFLDAAQRRGPGYSLYDMRTVDMLFSLIAVEYGCRNTGVIFGHGIADYRQPIEQQWDIDRRYYSRKDEQGVNTITCGLQPRPLITAGSCVCVCQGNQRSILTFARCTDIQVKDRETTYTFDGPPIDITTDCFIGNCAQSTNWTETCSAPYHGATGRANMIEQSLMPEERNPMRYRWIENVMGNIWHFLPDITFKDGRMYVCSDMTHYRFGCSDGAYEAYGPSFMPNNNNDVWLDEPYVNDWVTSLMSDEDYKGISFGDAFDRSLTSTAAFGAYYYAKKEGLYIAVNGGGFDHRFRCNLLTTRARVELTYRWHLYGARLLFKDITKE